MNILTIDIETKPIKGYFWRLRDENIGINQIIESDGILSFAAKWHGRPGVEFACVWDDGEARMLRQAHKLLDEADVVVGWNSTKFDVRWLKGQFIKHGMKPPSPFASVDLMRSVRYHAALPSYKLDYVARWLGVGGKIRTGGFDLWADLLGGCKKAQRLMRRYNIQDTRLTEKVFDVLRDKGWVRGLPNFAIEGGHCCPNCGSERLQARGFALSKTRRYQRWQCRECGGWSQSVLCEPGGAKLKAMA